MKNGLLWPVANRLAIARLSGGECDKAHFCIKEEQEFLLKLVYSKDLEL